MSRRRTPNRNIKIHFVVDVFDSRLVAFMMLIASIVITVDEFVADMNFVALFVVVGIFVATLFKRHA